MKNTKKKHLIFSRPVPGRGFVAPHFSRGAYHFMRSVGKLYLRFFEGVSSVSLKKDGSLINGFHAFYAEDTRLILTFRHSAKMDAPVLLYSLSKLLGKSARKQGLPMPTVPHVRFLYGKDVLNWAGMAAVWLFPRIGNIPVVNGESNRDSLSLLRSEIKSGRFPIALAPEGQVTYHMYRCSPIASGTASLAKWGIESGKDVTIIPIIIGYRYADDYAEFVLDMLGRWEKETGISLHLEGLSTSAKNEKSPLQTQQKIFNFLLDATHQTLLLLEDFYHLEKNSDIHMHNTEGLTGRISRVCESALHAAELLVPIEPQGSWLDRVFRIRYKGMSNLYPETFDPRKLHAFPRNIADFRSIEARIYLRHSQIVDVLEYFDTSYIEPPCEPERYCEYALNLLDVINRMKGGDINSRYNPGNIQAFVSAGEPISANEYFQSPYSPSFPDIDMHSSKKIASLRSAQTNLTDAIYKKLETLSQEMIL